MVFWSTALRWLLKGTTLKPVNNAQVVLPNGIVNKPSLSFNDGDSGFYEIAEDVIAVSINGVRAYSFSASYFLGYPGAGGVYFPTVASTSSIPGFTFYLDTDTGLGRAGANELSLICGGNDKVRINTAALVMKTAYVNAVSSVIASTNNASVVNVQVLYFNTAMGNIVLGGLSGGVTNQIVHLIKNNAINQLTIEHDENAGFQDILTTTGVDININGVVGGVTLIYDGANWIMLN